MFLKISGMIGAILLVAGIVLFTYLVMASPVRGAAPTQHYGERCGVDVKCRLSADDCSDVTNEISFSKPTISESDSLAVTVHLSNNDNRTCTGGVVLNAPNFDVSPARTTLRLELSPGHNTSSAVWILTPKKAGLFPITVSSGGYTAFNTVSEVNVTDILGLTPTQAKILSYVGTFGGAMLTAPWWYEQLTKRRNKTKKTQSTREKKK